jgi:hypothetical protein
MVLYVLKMQKLGYKVSIYFNSNTPQLAVGMENICFEIGKRYY